MREEVSAGGVVLFGNAILPRRKHNMRKLLLWLVMVAVMIAAILGGTAAFLYSRTGTDALPQEAVTFGEQTLEPNGWSWVIPVLGDKVNKTYESPTNLTVQKLGTFTDTVPQLVLPDWVTAAELQITAPDGTVWTGALADCNTYTYTQNGDYQIIVTARHSSADNPGDPVGWYAYRAGYTMAMNPKVTLSTERAPQGSIVAVQLSGILDGEPSLETDLGTVWFRKTASGYMGYIPVTYNAEGGDHTLHLTCGSLEKDITLTVTRTMYDTVTVPAEEDTGGGEEFRNAIWPLYTTGSSAKLWNGRFEAPSAGAVAMEYGVTQMVDGQRSGQATGLTYAAADGETVTVRGECEGELLHENHGAGGFGYDPLFYVEKYGCTFGELPAEIKNTISHRANALNKLKAILKDKVN